MINKVRQLCPASRRLFVWLGLLCFFGIRPAAARFDPVETQPVAPFRIYNQGGELGTEFHYLTESEKNGGESVNFGNTSMEEYILYRMKAYVYHPRLVDIDASFKLGLLQQSLSNSGLSGDNLSLRGGSSNTYLDAYSLYLNFLKDHPFSFSLWARHDRDAVMELFTDRLMIDTQDYGGALHWKKGPFPMDLSIGQTRNHEWGFDSTSDSSMRSLDYTIRNAVGRWMTSQLHYRFQDYEQSFTTDGPIKLDQHTQLRSSDLDFNNSIFFDAARRSSLSTSLRLFNQTGSQELSNAYWQERLMLQLTKKLRSYALFSIMNNRLRGQEISTWRGEAGLDHKLFDSLEEHLDLHWRESSFAGDTERQFGPTGRLAYTRRTPLGVLSAAYSHTLDQVERTGASGVRPIADEALTMHLGANNFLRNPGVVNGSIQVTDPTHNVTYQEGFDYEVILQGNLTALRILPGHRISDNQAVLVSYDVEFTSDIKFLSNDQDFNINYDFERYVNGLGLYYRWHNLSALDAPKDDLSILAFRQNTAGAVWRWRWLTWREEYNVYQSNFSDYNQVLSQLEGLHQIGDRLHLGWRLGYQATNYNNNDLGPGMDFDNAAFASLKLRGGLRTNGYWEVEGEARRETGQIQETLLGVMGKLGLRWRKSRVEAGVRVEDRNRYESQRNRTSVFLQFAREF